MPISLTRFSYPTTSLPAKPNPFLIIKAPNASLQFQSHSACNAAGKRPDLSSASSSFDSAAYEAHRLRLDAEARDSMASAAAALEEEDAGDPKAWKWKIRKRIWDLMERENIAQNPRPVHHRIPNFLGAAKAADLVSFLRLLCLVLLLLFFLNCL